MLRWQRYALACSLSAAALGAPAEGLAAPSIVLASESTRATPVAAAARHGVAVVGIGPSGHVLADAAWPVALAVYGDDQLRGAISDGDARVLAGEAAASDAPVSVRELGELREKVVSADDVASRALLAEIARRVGAVGLVLVAAPTVAVPGLQARLYDAAEDRLEAAYFPAVGAAPARWAPLTAALRARYVGGASPPRASDARGASTLAGEPRQPTATGALAPAGAPTADARGDFWSSPWFWGALGAAVAVGATAYILTHESSAPPAAVKFTWGK